MIKFRVIIANDDNSIHRVSECMDKEDAEMVAVDWAKSAFVVVLVSDDCFKYSDNILVKRARNMLTGK